MNVPTPLIRDVLPLLREQLSTEVVDELFLLAIDDPATFTLEMLATAKAGRVVLPTAVLDALEREVSRMGGAVHADPLVRRQRRIATVAAPRAARPAVGFNKAGLDPDGTVICS